MQRVNNAANLSLKFESFVEFQKYISYFLKFGCSVISTLLLIIKIDAFELYLCMYLDISIIPLACRIESWFVKRSMYILMYQYCFETEKLDLIQ